MSWLMFTWPAALQFLGHEIRTNPAPANPALILPWPAVLQFLGYGGLTNPAIFSSPWEQRRKKQELLARRIGDPWTRALKNLCWLFPLTFLLRQPATRRANAGGQPALVAVCLVDRLPSCRPALFLCSPRTFSRICSSRMA